MHIVFENLLSNQITLNNEMIQQQNKQEFVSTDLSGFRKFYQLNMDLHLHRSSGKPFISLYMLIKPLKKHIEIILILKVRNQSWLNLTSVTLVTLEWSINQNIYKYSEKKVMLVWQPHGSTETSQFKLTLFLFLNCLPNLEWWRECRENIWISVRLLSMFSTPPMNIKWRNEALVKEDTSTLKKQNLCDETRKHLYFYPSLVV